jgi:hypothetical protein
MLPSSAPAAPAQPLLTRPLVVDATSGIAFIQRLVPVERRAGRCWPAKPPWSNNWSMAR